MLDNPDGFSIRPFSFHPRHPRQNPPRLRRKEDWMQINEHDLYTIDQAVEEISSILARGYLHNEKSRGLATTSGGPAANPKQAEDSDLCTPLLEATSQCWSVGKEEAIPLEIRLAIQRVRPPHGQS
jgi:hypothetical protein